MKRIEDLLRDEATAILDEAALTIERLEHYHRDGDGRTLDFSRNAWMTASR